MESNDKPAAGLSDARQALLQRYLRGGMSSGDSAAAAIAPRTGSDPAPLSYSQQQMFLHSQLAGKALIYNEPITIHRHGDLNVAALERSFTEIVRRHEAWRTTFVWSGEQGVQIVQPPPALIAIPQIDLRSHPQAAAEALRLATADALLPFDLAQGPMYRLRLVRLGDTEHRLYLTLHHIIFDGVSLYRVLLPELLALYESCLKNETPSLPALPIQYPDYAAWQRKTIRGFTPAQLEYWQTVCTRAPVLDLQTDRPRPAAPTYAGRMELLQVSPATTAALKRLSQEEGATPFMTMVAAFVTLLHGYSGQEDIVIGGISSGRRHSETMGLLGCFLNTIPIRAAFTKDLPFTELLARVRTATAGALSHDEVPFELLVREFARQRDPIRAPLVQVLLVVEPPLEPLPAGWEFTHMDVETGTAKFDLQLGLDDRPEGLTGRFIYNTDLFDRETIALLKTRWLRLLDRIAAEPRARLCDLTKTVWGAPEHPQPPPAWNATRTDYPRDASVHSLFEEQARRTPTAPAIIFGDASLSYDALNRRANRLARRLQKFGVTRDLPVGICLERSFDMVIALLAILKAGGAYVPLDPSYPTERLMLMIENTGTPLILTNSRLGPRCHPEPRKLSGSEDLTKSPSVLCLDEDEDDEEDENDLRIESRAEDLAYIMFTSGSTGTPKGVAIPHRGVVRLVKGTDYASFSADETFLQLAPLSFDASTFEIWGPLLNGGRLVMMPPAPPTLAEIGEAIRAHSVTTLWLTAALFNAMVDERLVDLQPLRQLLAGGDVLSVPHVRKVLRGLTKTRLINGYGPTESTTFACCHTILSEAPLQGPVPIGKPIANTTAHILDENLQPVAVGAVGELHLGGDGLARGYWRRPELTAEKFIADPFSQESGARLYKTGDLARWRADGVIEFLGRADNQIKLRGYRIEPEEIETALKQQPHVRDSAVIVREDTLNDKRLVAYVVCEATAAASFDQSALLAALKKTLPDYMVPTAIVPLPALPCTPNGKLDRRALPAPAASVNFVPAKTPLEKKLAAIWASVLEVDRVGVSDNFFDLGGHSLVALRLVNQLREVLGEHLSLVVLFEAPTVAAMAHLLQSTYPAAVVRWVGQSAAQPGPPNEQKTATILPFSTGRRTPDDSSRPSVPVLRPLPPVVPINRDSRRASRPAREIRSHD